MKWTVKLLLVDCAGFASVTIAAKSCSRAMYTWQLHTKLGKLCFPVSTEQAGSCLMFRLFCVSCTYVKSEWTNYSCWMFFGAVFFWPSSKLCEMHPRVHGLLLQRSQQLLGCKAGTNAGTPHEVTKVSIPGCSNGSCLTRCEWRTPV